MIYCISDIHGCYEKFMELLEKIQFNPKLDKLYILGDAIDRGKQPLECLMFIIKTASVYLILGNHEQMMLDYYDCKDNSWHHNGCEATTEQINGLMEFERTKLLSYIRSRPYYKTVAVNGKRYFLSHSGLAVSVPFKYQSLHDLIWSRSNFYERQALKRHICIFGHTPSFHIRNSDDYSVWFDPIYNDKVCIDCGCVYGGALAAIRLDDGEVFYSQNIKK